MDYDGFTCFRCGQPGHFSAQCPTRTANAHPPAPPAESRAPEQETYTPPPPPLWRAGVPPTEEYLAVKAGMGMPAQSQLGRLLTVPCPWCGAGKMTPCRNAATGQRKLEMHEARYVAVLAPLPYRASLADLAAEQAAESRAMRIVFP